MIDGRRPAIDYAASHGLVLSISRDDNFGEAVLVRPEDAFAARLRAPFVLSLPGTSGLLPHGASHQMGAEILQRLPDGAACRAAAQVGDLKGCGIGQTTTYD
jgi:hypothetical protein